MNRIYQEITEHLHSLAHPKTAEHSQRFFKTGEGEYGFGDKFLGIRVPVIRKTVKKFKAAPLDVIVSLLKSEYHEIRLCALLMLVARFSRASDDEQSEIYQIYLNHTQYVNNWDLVDSSSHHILGAYLDGRDRSILYDLSKSASLWERRIAIISTYYFINKKNQFNDTLQISEQLLSDQEELIHKAVGWMLREVGKRDLATEVDFLKSHYQQMPRTMLRYAIEKFDPSERQKYLRGEV
ncbi:MAG TPA: DNA alkylation repair protein [Gammaproteobacteria bacterium]|nr:DNA alkylation repair protein [Gammaproteobacteria bacterium]